MPYGVFQQFLSEKSGNLFKFSSKLWNNEIANFNGILGGRGGNSDFKNRKNIFKNILFTDSER